MASVIAAPLTLEEFEQLPDDGVHHEINAGELITRPTPKSLHSRIAATVQYALRQYYALAGAVYVLAENPLTVRLPAVSVISNVRVAATDPDSYFKGAPEVAIEIVSPSDLAEELDIKVVQYLQAGARQVWVLYPKTERIHVFSSTGSSAILDENQTLEGGELLPGFSVKVADLFAI